MKLGKQTLKLKVIFLEWNLAEIKYIGEIATNFAQIIDSKVF